MPAHPFQTSFLQGGFDDLPSDHVQIQGLTPMTTKHESRYRFAYRLMMPIQNTRQRAYKRHRCCAANRLGSGSMAIPYRLRDPYLLAAIVLPQKSPQLTFPGTRERSRCHDRHYMPRQHGQHPRDLLQRVRIRLIRSVALWGANVPDRIGHVQNPYASGITENPTEHVLHMS